MPEMPTITLNNGVTIPQLGFGVFQVPPSQTEDIVSQAFKAGYRHIDTAAGYHNEEGVGAAIKAAGLPRDELFITTKLANGDQGRDSALRAFDVSMAALGLDVLDLYLIHWPCPHKDRYVESWLALEELYAQGRIRAIGVSNFQPGHLQRLADETEIVPTVNQIELHPYLAQEELRLFDTANGVATEAWSPIGRGGALLDDPELLVLAEKYGRTPAQLVLRWHLQLDNIVIPKSATPARIAENIDILDFELDEHDLASITALDRGERIGPDPDHFG